MHSFYGLTTWGQYNCTFGGLCERHGLTWGPTIRHTTHDSHTYTYIYVIPLVDDNTFYNIRLFAAFGSWTLKVHVGPLIKALDGKCSRTYLLSAKLTCNCRLISSAAQSLRLPKLPGQFATPYCIHGICSDTTWHCNQDDEAFDEVSELFFIHLCCIYLIYIFRGKVTNLHTVVKKRNISLHCSLFDISVEGWSPDRPLTQYFGTFKQNNYLQTPANKLYYLENAT